MTQKFEFPIHSELTGCLKERIVQARQYSFGVPGKDQLNNFYQLDRSQAEKLHLQCIFSNQPFQ